MIIDSHTHIGILPPFYMTPDMLLRSMERFGIDFSLVSNIEAAEKDHEGGVQMNLGDLDILQETGETDED